jgi:hypothetical protein
MKLKLLKDEVAGSGPSADGGLASRCDRFYCCPRPLFSIYSLWLGRGVLRAACQPWRYTQLLLARDDASGFIEPDKRLHLVSSKLSSRWVSKPPSSAPSSTIAASLASLSGATIAASGAALRNCDSKVSSDRRDLMRARRGERRCDCWESSITTG